MDEIKRAAEEALGRKPKKPKKEHLAPGLEVALEICHESTDLPTAIVAIQTKLTEEQEGD